MSLSQVILFVKIFVILPHLKVYPTVELIHLVSNVTDVFVNTHLCRFVCGELKQHKNKIFREFWVNAHEPECKRTKNNKKCKLKQGHEPKGKQ